METSLDKVEDKIQIYHLHTKLFHTVKRLQKSVQYFQSWQRLFVNVWYNTAKKLAYLVKFPDILDRFSQSFHHMKALWVQMMDLYIIFRFVKGHCHGNQILLGETRK